MAPIQTLKAESISNETLICIEPVPDLYTRDFNRFQKKKAKDKQLTQNGKKMLCLRYLFHKNVVDLV